MASGGQLDSHVTCEGGVLSASNNSPRFDINEFLKTPKDVNNMVNVDVGDQFFNLATGFNMLAHNNNNIAFNNNNNNRRGGRDENQSDFSALLFDNKTGSPEAAAAAAAVAAYAEDTLNGELIAFDEIDADIAKDSFSLFSHDNSHVSYMINHGQPSPLEVPSYVPVSSRGLPNAMLFTAAGAYGMGVDPGVVDDRGFVGMEHGASTSGGEPGAPLEWGMARESCPIQPNFGQAAHNHHQQFQCASCHILRRIIHSNGVQDTKLEIHGCDGQSYHAVLQTRFCIDDGFPASFEQQMVEFPVGNAEYVKQFLLQYSLLRRKEGFLLRHDSLASHASGGLAMGTSAGCLPKQMGHMILPDVLCTSSECGAPKNEVVSKFCELERGLCDDKSRGSSDPPWNYMIILDYSNSGCAYGKAGLGQHKVHRSGSIDSTDNAEVTVGPAKPPKSNAAAQRERTGKLKMTDLAQHFHLPINAAAKELGICPTVLKKICRRNGMRRWPHRKIKSIERIIATLEQTIAEGAGQGDEGIRMEIAMLRNERAQLCAGFLGDT